VALEIGLSWVVFIVYLLVGLDLMTVCLLIGQAGNHAFAVVGVDTFAPDQVPS
jgi:hypothetical protein